MLYLVNANLRLDLTLGDATTASLNLSEQHDELEKEKTKEFSMHLPKGHFRFVTQWIS